VTTRPRWLVTSSCGWNRECISRWAAKSVAKLHPSLNGPGATHTVTIEEPPAELPAGEQLTLTWRYSERIRFYGPCSLKGMSLRSTCVVSTEP
jgi:hypothetical protein